MSVFKSVFYFCLIFIAVSCSNAGKNPDLSDNEVTGSIAFDTSIFDPAVLSDTAGDEMEDLFVLVLDTSRDYYELREKMFSLQNSGDFIIDSMGRHYDPEKDQILVPEDDEDEMYRGEYYPRLTESENLSIEYMEQYMANANKHSLALIGGIYKDKMKALSRKNKLKSIFSSSFVLKSRLYQGCMH